MKVRIGINLITRAHDDPEAKEVRNSESKRAESSFATPPN
jgi:hypothetical protein